MGSFDLKFEILSVQWYIEAHVEGLLYIWKDFGLCVSFRLHVLGTLISNFLIENRDLFPASAITHTTKVLQQIHQLINWSLQ
jgi:hypothetical protein